MKKIYVLFTAALLSVMPAFSATISVVRKKAAEIDLSPAKTISFKTEIVDKKYRSEQMELAKMFTNELQTYIGSDGRFTLLKEGSEKSDIVLLFCFESFSVSDKGITLTQKVDGQDVVITDEWKRAISGNYSISFIRTSDDVVLGKKSYKIFEGNADAVPKAELVDPVLACEKKMSDGVYFAAIMIFDTQYQEPISLQDSKTKDKAVKEQMKAALKLAKGRNYEQARDAYKEIYEATDDPAAGYNYARMLQVVNSFDEAVEILNKVSTGDKDKTVKKALESISKDRENYDKIAARKK